MKKKLLIVCPYRSREKDYVSFLENVPKYFDGQGITYDILMAELAQGGDWNCGLTNNSVYDLKNLSDYEFIYISHVDIYPVDEYPIKIEFTFPKENECFFHYGDYGSCLISVDNFIKVNGYDNEFWGWGAEDNEFYQRLRGLGIKVSDQNEIIKYNTEAQSHPRKFVGKNYAWGVQKLYLKKGRGGFKNFPLHAMTLDLKMIGENIYHHTVIPNAISPNKTVNNKVVLGYLINHKDCKDLYTYIKSVMLFAAYNYDVVIIIADENPSEGLLNELIAFGLKPVSRPKTHADLFIDRWLAYQEFLQGDDQYGTVLHTDVSDVFFQGNPFEFIQGKGLFIGSEAITIDAERWNSAGVKFLYGEEIYEKIKHQEVVCGGIIGGSKEGFLKFAAAIIKEDSQVANGYNGRDQILMLKIIYVDAFTVTVLRPQEGKFIHLHSVKHYPHLFGFLFVGEKTVVDLKKMPFNIVHQFTQFDALRKGITKHCNSGYSPAWL